VEARFSEPVQTGTGAHPASCTMGTWSLFRGSSGRDVALTVHPPASAEVKERVELYLFFSSRSSWPVIGFLYVYLYISVVLLLLFKM
jgi:hypothetical protein